MRGAQFDSTVLVGGALTLGVALLGLLASMAWRRARPRLDTGMPAPSAVAQAAAAAGLPRVVALGIRFALEPPAGGRKSAVRANLAGSVVAVLAVVTAAVFGASLDGLVSHPDRYGWNWDVLIQNQGGYGTFLTSANPAAFHGGDGTLDRLMDSEHGVSRLVDVRLHPAPHRRPNRARARTGHPPRFGGTSHRQRAALSMRPSATASGRRQEKSPTRSSWERRPCASWASTWGTP